MTSNRRDGERSELGHWSSTSTSTKEPATADDTEGDVEDRTGSRTTASAESTAVTSEGLEGTVMSVEVVPADVVSAVHGDTARNISDVEARVQLRHADNDVLVDEHVNDKLVSFLNHVLTSHVANADDVDDDAVLLRDDNRDYHGVRNDNKNRPESSTVPLPSMQTLAADYTANTRTSVAERDRVLSTEMPADDSNESLDSSANVDSELLKILSWQRLHNDGSSTLLRSLDDDSASKLFEQIVNSPNNENESGFRSSADLFQRNTNRTQSTALSTDRATSVDLTESREASRRGPLSELAQLESTTIASPAIFPRPGSEKTSRQEPTSDSEQTTVKCSTRYRYKAATTTVKAKPDVITGNGNSVPICCQGKSEYRISAFAYKL